jgi:acyl-CoA thioester hydrolase
MVHEKRIEIRWHDVDAYQHVNNAVYATYLEECRDEWLARALDGAGDEWDFVLAHVAIDFRRELRLDDEYVVVSCRIERIGTSSLTLREEIHADDGWLAAEAEAVLVARDREAGRSRPLTGSERGLFERALSGVAGGRRP